MAFQKTDDNKADFPKSRKPHTTGPMFGWFIFALTPGLVCYPFLSVLGRTNHFSDLLLETAAAVCSLVSGIGVLSSMKNQAARILLGLLLAGIFFVMNIFVGFLVAFVMGIFDA